jgi:hypothetical protein
VNDSVTGLSWQGCPAGLTGNACAAGTAGTYSWASALGYCAGLNWGRSQDWRLPNAKELRSIVNDRRSSPAIDVAAFPNTPAAYSWSSSSVADFSGNAWGVYFDYGFVNGPGKSSNNYVRCVRSGP